jgi:hypothetical protein
MKRILLVSSNRSVISSELTESAGYGLDYQKIGTAFDSRQLKRFISSKGLERFRGLCCVLSNRNRGLLPHGKADCLPLCNSEVKTLELSHLPQTSQLNSLFYMLCLCNKNQLDALFIPSLFLQSTYTCFGQICSPSAGGILYIYNNWYVLCFLVDRVLAARSTHC